MKKGLLDFDFRSLVLVFIAFIGNGQIMGVDVVLLLLPLAVILQLRDRWVIQANSVLPMFIVILILTLTIVRAPAVGIPYFESYALWPIKALFLMLLLTFGRDLDWPLGNMIALSLICVLLIAVGEVQDGRLISVFGPNMLYRIFGLLLFLSAMQYFEKQVGSRILFVGFAAFSITASLLTGSTGALLVIAAILFIVSLRISKLLSFMVIGASLYWIMTSGIMSGTFTVGVNAPTTLTRLIYKSTTVMVSDRFLGWIDIARSPFSLIGYAHSDFSNIWTYGFEYPHNLFVELYGFYGLPGLALVLIIAVAITRSIALALQGDIIAMTFLVLTIGSMLSGDLSDNYGVVGLACGLLLRSAHSRSPKFLDGH
ncbi:hypothetical protein [Yoonia sp. 2307UL14-13]|uniref:hypothetical protein n=1 Tax=Yoonia sp. 2307UL14-13 TaxID=3126506 RepID=UPI0030AD6173